MFWHDDHNLIKSNYSILGARAANACISHGWLKIKEGLNTNQNRIF